MKWGLYTIEKWVETAARCSHTRIFATGHFGQVQVRPHTHIVQIGPADAHISSTTVRLTPSLNSPFEYVAQRLV
jgi:hypothetical protein